MTKQEIVTTVYEKLGFSKRESSDIVEHFFKLVKERLAQGENVKISGLGNFVVKDKKARKGRNPQTGEEIEIAPRRVLSFRLSQVLKDEINDNHHNGT
ncbi:MAG: integration host factor subunit alpha [Syntrophorhabdales bacterium]|jgi:integration host factor subunit alpha